MKEVPDGMRYMWDVAFDFPLCKIEIAASGNFHFNIESTNYDQFVFSEPCRAGPWTTRHSRVRTLTEVLDGLDAHSRLHLEDLAHRIVLDGLVLHGVPQRLQLLRVRDAAKLCK